jgi:hypothetical protein
MKSGVKAAARKPRRAVPVGIANGIFPKLRVELYRGGTLVKVEEFDDPREEFCRFFNEQQERIEAMVKEATKAATGNGLEPLKLAQVLYQ